MVDPIALLTFYPHVTSPIDFTVRHDVSVSRTAGQRHLSDDPVLWPVAPVANHSDGAPDGGSAAGGRNLTWQWRDEEIEDDI